MPRFQTSCPHDMFRQCYRSWPPREDSDDGRLSEVRNEPVRPMRTCKERGPEPHESKRPASGALLIRSLLAIPLWGADLLRGGRAFTPVYATFGSDDTVSAVVNATRRCPASAERHFRATHADQWTLGPMLSWAAPLTTLVRLRSSRQGSWGLGWTRPADLGSR